MMDLIREGVAKSNNALALVTCKMLATIGNNHYRRFIVLSRSRTGSNLLISLLNSHPHIHAKGEVFSRLNGGDYRQVLAKAFSKQPYYVKAHGFKFFYYHPLDDPSCGIWEHLQSLDDLYIIHLKRKNTLRTLLSRKIAGTQDIWLVRSNQCSSSCSKKLSVRLTVNELNEGFKQTKEWEEVGNSTFRNHPLLSIDYEDMVSDRAATFRKVTDFLGVQYKQPKSELKKQNNRSMRETIINYDELKSSSVGTEWEPFLED